jgi:hypothetical protein
MIPCPLSLFEQEQEYVTRGRELDGRLTSAEMFDDLLRAIDQL